MLKFLVTGAAGQLGKDVVRELENRGYEVTGSGSKKRKTTGRYVKMDITDRNEGSNEKAQTGYCDPLCGVDGGGCGRRAGKL